MGKQVVCPCQGRALNPHTDISGVVIDGEAFIVRGVHPTYVETRWCLERVLDGECVDIRSEVGQELYIEKRLKFLYTEMEVIAWASSS